mgnify:CR=1 FL=1
MTPSLRSLKPQTVSIHSTTDRAIPEGEPGEDPAMGRHYETQFARTVAGGSACVSGARHRRHDCAALCHQAVRQDALQARGARDVRQDAGRDARLSGQEQRVHRIAVDGRPISRRAGPERLRTLEQAFVCIYAREKKSGADIAQVLNFDEARRIVVDVAKRTYGRPMGIYQPKCLRDRLLDMMVSVDLVTG